MTDELVFYTNPMSRGRIVRWMLEEVGQPYHTEMLDYATTLKAPAYLAINPMGKVPAMKHGDTVVTEVRRHLRLSGRCVSRKPAWRRRTATACAAPLPLAVFRRRPGRVGGRQTKSWALWCPTGREPMAGYGSFEDVMNTLEGAVSHGAYLAGDSFTAADLYLGSQIGFGLSSAPSKSGRPSRNIGSGSPTARRQFARARSTTRCCQRNSIAATGLNRWRRRVHRNLASLSRGAAARIAVSRFTKCSETASMPSMLLTTVTENFDRISMHGVRRSLLERQAASLGIPLIEVLIPKGASNAQYEERMGVALAAAQRRGIEAVVFGDLFLADVRAYRERLLARHDLAGLYPIWGRDTAETVREFPAVRLQGGSRLHRSDQARS